MESVMFFKKCFKMPIGGTSVDEVNMNYSSFMIGPLDLCLQIVLKIEDYCKGIRFAIYGTL